MTVACISSKKMGSLSNIHKPSLQFFMFAWCTADTSHSSSPYRDLWIFCMNSHYSQLALLACRHVVCESKSPSPPAPCSHTPCTSRCLGTDPMDAFLQPPWSMWQLPLCVPGVIITECWCFQTLPLTRTPTCHPSVLLPQPLSPSSATSPALSFLSCYWNI